MVVKHLLNARSVYGLEVIRWVDVGVIMRSAALHAPGLSRVAQPHHNALRDYAFTGR